jgi:hypothetical protein
MSRHFSCMPTCRKLCMWVGNILFCLRFSLPPSDHIVLACQHLNCMLTYFMLCYMSTKTTCIHRGQKYSTIITFLANVDNERNERGPNVGIFFLIRQCSHYFSCLAARRGNYTIWKCKNWECVRHKRRNIMGPKLLMKSWLTLDFCIPPFP